MGRTLIFLAVFFIIFPALAREEDQCVSDFNLGKYVDALINCGIAAQSGSAIAQVYMGGMYYHGLGIDQSYEHAFAWYKQAAEQGNADAQFSIGKMHEKSQGIEQNYKLAFYWYKQAAKQDHTIAMYNIGNMYGKGYGLERDYKKAYEWFKKAADKNHGKAMYAVGQLYLFGKGVPHDPVKSFMWFNLAHKYGVSQAASFQSKIAAQLTPQQLLESANLLKAWENRDTTK